VTGLFSVAIPSVSSPLRRRFVAERFGVAVVAAALAILLRWILDPVLGHEAFYVTLYMAVAFCALVFGVAPAILSALLGFLGIFYWFVDPRHSFTVYQRSDLHGIIGFWLVCAVLIALGQMNRSAQFALNDTIGRLHNEATERAHAEELLQKAHDQLEQRVEERTTQLSRALARVESEVGVRKQAEEQLRYLSVRLMSLQDEERRRIARDLHDTTGQTLAAIKMNAAALQRVISNPKDLLRLTDDLSALADEALQEIRTTSYLLHPPLLDEAGIASAARWFAEGFAKRSGIHVQCSIPEDLQRLPRNCELALFRVLQESLTNVHRYSKATEARIDLCAEDHQVRFEVADNGVGIPEDRMQELLNSGGSTGVGIAGMRERVRELAGQLQIESTSGGTRVIVTLPVAETLGADPLPGALTASPVRDSTNAAAGK
jgi:signal transduction histidine kinase